MSEIGGSNLACPLPFGPIRHAVKRHRPFPCSDPAFAPPVEFRYLFDPENKTDGSAAAAGDVKEESILENFHLMQMIEAEAQKVKAAEWAPSQACPKAVNNGNTPISKTMARRYNKQRVLKNGRHGQRSPVLTAGKNSPSDNSFTLTNSCLGFDASGPGDVGDDAARLKDEVSNLYADELALDDEIREMQGSISTFWEVPDNQRLLFVSEDDIKRLPHFQNETLIAIKAPHGTTLEVPDPDVSDNYLERHYQMLLRSMVGPINVYLGSHSDDIDLVELPYSEIDSSTCGRHHKGTCQEAGTLGYAEIQGVDPGVDYPQDRSAGIVKIVPFEDSNEGTDYWLLSETGVSITDMWTSVM